MNIKIVNLPKRTWRQWFFGEPTIKSYRCILVDVPNIESLVEALRLGEVRVICPPAVVDSAYIEIRLAGERLCILRPLT